MDRSYTEEERFSLLQQYVSSGLSKTRFCRLYGVTHTSLLKWQRRYGLPDPVSIEEEPTSSGMPSDLDKLRAELTALRREKKLLERELEKERIRSLAYNTLIDLAESTYHIKVRKNSGAK